jgi:predicted short-subunit dehydrogenase-like oxidoreductase (DUF2520 family)
VGAVASLRVIGPGRAGGALARAAGAVGWQVEPTLGRGDDPSRAADGVDLLVIATPDAAIGAVAASVEPGAAVVAHLSGALGLDLLGDHARRAALHPLVALPDAEVGARRLTHGAWFAVAGHPLDARVVVESLVDDLGGRSFVVDDAHRAAYHAAAVIASNHVVALLAQAERVAATAGVPLEAYLDLVRATIDNVAELGAAAALTGPVARGDWGTVERHRAAIGEDELAGYDAMVALARRLVDGDT